MASQARHWTTIGAAAAFIWRRWDHLPFSMLAATAPPPPGDMSSSSPCPPLSSPHQSRRRERWPRTRAQRQAALAVRRGALGGRSTCWASWRSEGAAPRPRSVPGIASTQPSARRSRPRVACWVLSPWGGGRRRAPFRTHTHQAAQETRPSLFPQRGRRNAPVVPVVGGRPNLGSGSAEFRPISAKLGCARPKLGQLWPKLDGL